MDFLNGVNKNQLAAIKSENTRVLVLAGAGTGKTFTLTRRIAYVNQNGVSCGNIAALTFTRLAGREMKERLFKLVGENEVKKLFCNTFHSFCVKILKEFGYLIGYSDNFSIYDPKHRNEIIAEILDDLHIKAGKDDVLLCLKDESIIDKKYSEAMQAAKEYRYYLNKNNAVDLELILNDTLKLLQDFPEVKEHYHDIYKYIFVDEYQDTDKTQKAIIMEINPVNLFVIGDDSQSLYSWRGADITNILNFQNEFPGCEVIKLEDNYRSTKQIIAAGNSVIKYNKKQVEKTLKSEKEGEPVELYVAGNEADEANFIVKYIKNNNRPYDNYAVLSRNNSQLVNVIQYFNMHQIPFKVVADKDNTFSGEKVSMILSYIEAGINIYNDVLIKKIINFPVKRLNSLEMSELEVKALDEDISLFEALESSDKEKIVEFVSIIKSLSENNIAVQNASEAYKDTAKKLHLTAGSNVLEKIKDFELIQGTIGEEITAEAFLKWLIIKDLDNNESVKESNEVKLLTMHGSKGLEFPVVFCIGLNDGYFPSKRGDLEEERRIAYVAFTRAKEKLFLTRAKKINAPYGNLQINTTESRFIKEAGL